MAKKKKPGLWSKQSIYKKADGTEVVMDSSWEHICAAKLDEAGIEWRRSPNMILEYRTVRNRKRKYIPDFYLPEHDIYLEVKGFWTDAARHKMKDVQHRNPVRILILESMPEVLSVGRLIETFLKGEAPD
jgi:predicted nuclease of restriction endonuclease-like RecB superfamily